MPPEVRINPFQALLAGCLVVPPVWAQTINDLSNETMAAAGIESPAPEIPALPPGAIPASVAPVLSASDDPGQVSQGALSPDAAEAGAAALSAIEAPVGSAAPGAPAGAKGKTSAKAKARKAAAPPVAMIPNPELPSEINLFVGETKVVPRLNVGRLAVGNGRVLSAAVLDDRQILIIANAAGNSSIEVWDRDGRTRKINVHVLAADMARVTYEIVDFLREIPNVGVRTIGDKVVVQGNDLTDEDRFKIDELAKKYPQIINFTARLGWERMIYMDVKVVEFSRTVSENLGIQWINAIQGPAAGVAGDLKTNGLYRVIGNVNGEQTFPLKVSPFQTYFGIVSQITSTINLLEQHGDAVILASPQLIARNGSKAHFQSGGEIPYIVTTSLGSSNVQFKNYGIILDIVPRADASGAIRSEISAEVSEPDNSLTTATGAIALKTRKTNTEFNIREGQTMVLAGLRSRQKSKTVNQLPGLGDLPLIGGLFRSKQIADDDTELVIFVTPHIVATTSEETAELRQTVESTVDGVIHPPQEPAAPPPEPKPAPATSAWPKSEGQ